MIQQSSPAQPSREQATVAQLIHDTAARFAEAALYYGHGTDNPYDEAAWLMLHVLQAPDYDLEPFLDTVLPEAEAQRFASLAQRRIAERTPLAYLLNEAWLGDHRFYVDERVIVPRSFIAELLAEQLAPWIQQPEAVHSVLDMCTGSGCLAILAALAYPHAQVDAVDLSTDALAVAKQNVEIYGLTERVQLTQSDLFDDLPAKRYDLIVANPPYVDAPSMQSLPDEYRREPEMALASGSDGLDATRRLLRSAGDFLKDDGLLVVEIGHNRAALERAFPHLPFTWLEVSAGDEYVFLLEKEQLR